MTRFSPSSRGRLTGHDLGRFPGESLFDRLARAVCRAGCLPRKELYESWELARRARRLFRGGRVVDLCAGHGLVAHILLLVDDTSPSALVVDTTLAPSSRVLHEVLIEVWPRLANRVAFDRRGIDHVDLAATDLVVSAHPCGALADLILDRAAGARARVAVLPCCHDLGSPDAREWRGWVDGSLAIDLARALRLRQRGYRVWMQTIPAAITPKNRLLLGAPVEAGQASPDVVSPEA